MVRSSHIVSAAPSCSGGGHFTLFPCSGVGSLSQETVLHELLQRESFPRATVLHELLQCGSFPRGAVLQQQGAPAWVPTGSQALTANLFWHGLLCPRVRSSWQEPAPVWALRGVTALFGHPRAPLWGPRWAAGGYLLHHRPPWAAGGQPASPQSSPWAAGESLLCYLEHLLHLLLP